MAQHAQGGRAAQHPRLAGVALGIRAWLPPLNFITIHYAYFLVVPLVSSLVFWGSSDPAYSISYTDSLFLVVSAMTEAGLNTVNLSQMTTWQQTILFLLILLGSSIWVSIWTVAFRKHVFEQRFKAIVRADRARRLRRSSSTSRERPRLSARHRVALFFRRRTARPLEDPVLPAPIASSSPPGPDHGDGRPPTQASAAGGHESLSPSTPSGGHITFAQAPHHAGEGSSAYELTSRGLARRAAQAALDEDAARDQQDEKPGISFGLGPLGFLSQRTVSRNAQFHGLTREEREELGGCEYRALKLLSIVVPLYSFLWQFLGCLALGAWINNHMASVATSNGINPWWLGIFNGASAFNNSGMSLLDANMIPFENAHFVMITMGLMILAGNTAYPVFLRLIFWSSLKILCWTTEETRFSATKATLTFVLQYPRRVYTNLFPARPTWWLLFMIVLLNCIDWVAFELLNIGNPVISDIPTGSRILDGLFQALAVRSGGFYIVPITEVYIGLQVLYVIMMYISVYPVVITMRNSNVYEERSLGVYSSDPDRTADLEDAASDAQSTPRSPVRAIGRVIGQAFLPWHGVGVRPPSARGEGSESRIHFISQQIHGQLAHDLWLLVLVVLVISTIETSHFLADPVTYSVFHIIFEVVSAYGCVGISPGVPFAAYSFSGGLHNASKLVLCAVMIRGRHRGLPVALDRAVRLPGEQLHRDEEEDYHIRRSMTIRRRSVDRGVLSP